jgi:hypothetical protein
MDVRHADRSFTDVLADIFRNVQDILHSEIRLAQSEFRDDLVRARPGAIFVAAALGGALLSALFLLLAILHALRLVMPAWAAALCVATALALVSAMGMVAGVRQLRALSARSRPGDRVKERAEWAKGQSG